MPGEDEPTYPIPDPQALDGRAAELVSFFTHGTDDAPQFAVKELAKYLFGAFYLRFLRGD